MDSYKRTEDRFRLANDAVFVNVIDEVRRGPYTDFLARETNLQRENQRISVENRRFDCPLIRFHTQEEKMKKGGNRFDKGRREKLYLKKEQSCPIAGTVIGRGSPF